LGANYLVMKNKFARTRTPAPPTNASRIGPDDLSLDAGRMINRLPAARMGIELTVPVGNTPGLLAKVLGVVTASQVNMMAYCTLFDLDRFAILLVTDAAWMAKTALADAGFACVAHSVVLVNTEHRADIQAALLHQLRDAQIEIRYAYSAALNPPAVCTVFSTVDDPRALQVLAAAKLVHIVVQ
jgi:hypothetical protein